MIWLIGANGMLGTELAKQLTENNISWIGSDKEIDITDQNALDSFALSHSPSAERTGYSAQQGHIGKKINWIINCAAYTNVDKAETEQDECFKLNKDGPLHIARTARRINAKLIHISTDYVYDGTSAIPYTEDKPFCPINIYGKSKAEGETLIQKEMTQYYILRTSWLYGFNGKNFVYTMTNAMNNKKSISIVSDQKGSPTFASDLASLIIKIIETSENAHTLVGKKSALPYGTYNYTNEGEISWYDFAQKIYKLGKKYKKITNECFLEQCSSQEYKTEAQRPSYSVLSKEKIQKALKIKIPKWNVSLEKFIKSKQFDLNIK